MGNTNYPTTNNLKPQTIAFKGENTLKDFPKHIKYNDDDEIVFENKNFEHNMVKNNDPCIDINEYFDIAGKIQINSKLEYKALDISKISKNKTIYHMLTTTSVADVQSKTKTSIDLICVIDRSWSMKGKKMDLLKDSFKYLLRYLDEHDRLCIIVFDDEIERLTPLLCMNDLNKGKTLELLNKVVPKGGTNIASAIQHSFEVIKQRKYVNNVSSIFLLSDGIDLNADLKIKNLLKREKFFMGTGEVISSKTQHNFTINTFGYGSDHDAKLMTNIAQLADGTFYFVDDLNIVDESFLGCFGGIVSVIAQDCIIKIYPDKTLCKINKIYGAEDTITYDEKENCYMISILQLISGRRFNFLIDLEVDLNKNMKVLENNNMLNLCDIKCSFNGLRESGFQEIFLDSKCSVLLAKESDKLTEEENINTDVIFNYYRLKSGESLREAKNLSDVGKYEEAKTLLTKLIKEMKEKENLINTVDFNNLINDVETSLLYVDPNTFKKDGRHYLVQTYDSQLREKHNLILRSQNVGCGQERFISQHKSYKYGL
jgi:Mg-chelatase subunit ChlD